MMSREPAQILAMVALACGVCNAQAQMGTAEGQPWKLDLSVGAVRGTQSYFKGLLLRSRTDPLVVIDAAKGRWIASTVNGVGYLLADDPVFSLGVSANYMLGRQESHEPRYKGLGNVAGTVGAYGFFEWRPVKEAVTVYGNVLRSARSQSGTLATLGATLALPVTPRLSGFVDVYANWADQRYTQTYYGVDTAQAASAAYPAYAAKSGLLSTTPSVGVNYNVDKHWDVIAYVGRTRLSSGAAASPLVQHPSQSVAAVFVKYQR